VKIKTGRNNDHWSKYRVRDFSRGVRTTKYQSCFQEHQSHCDIVSALLSYLQQLFYHLLGCVGLGLLRLRFIFLLKFVNKDNEGN
jgi:hypothetical protein